MQMWLNNSSHCCLALGHCAIILVTVPLACLCECAHACMHVILLSNCGSVVGNGCLLLGFSCIWFCWIMVTQSPVKSTGQRALCLIKVSPSEKNWKYFLSSNAHSYLSCCDCGKRHVWHFCR